MDTAKDAAHGILESGCDSSHATVKLFNASVSGGGGTENGV